jgi:ubiquinone/menaquinone biosynthesis C-methylase UbiE
MMTRNRNLKRRIRLRMAKTGESYTAARRHVAPAARSTAVFEREIPADYLARAAATPIARTYKSLALEKLRLPAGATVLDIGCGTGEDLSPLLDAVGPHGAVIGVDVDEKALATARASHDHEQLRLLRADAHELDFADASVDAVHTDRTLQHVDSPQRMLRELRRVLVPGGTAVFAEPDWQTLIVDCPAPRLSAAYRRFVEERVIRNARIGSELPRLVRRAGFELESVTPVTAVYTDAYEADRILGFARVTHHAVAEGCFGTRDAGEWLAHLSGDVFFASLTIFIVAAHATESG